MGAWRIIRHQIAMHTFFFHQCMRREFTQFAYWTDKGNSLSSSIYLPDKTASLNEKKNYANKNEIISKLSHYKEHA